MDARTNSPPCKKPRSSCIEQAGFTLIELMIAVVVIGILAAIALPNYQEYVRKSRRGDAQSFLADLVVRQQQYLLATRSYATSVTNAANAGGLGVAIPANVSNYYTVTIATNNAAPPSYVISAAPTGTQATEPCGTLKITETGTKTVTGSGKCW